MLANVFGYYLEDYVEVIRVLEDAEGLAGYELNISCPNVKKGGMQFGSDPGLVAEVVGAARKAAIRRPLWVKLSPLVTDIGLIARPPRRWRRRPDRREHLPGHGRRLPHRESRV